MESFIPLPIAALETNLTGYLGVFLDVDWPTDQHLKEFFDTDAPYLAVTQNQRYTTLVSRLSMLNSIVKTLFVKK